MADSLTRTGPGGEAAGSLARADRQLARSVLALFALAAAVAVLGPLLSYRSDLTQLQDLFRTRVIRESSEDANALARHLRLLRTELERLADRPEVDLLDASMRPEQELLDSAHRNSTLFDQGVAIVDASGALVWSEPASVRSGDVVGGDWFARLQRAAVGNRSEPAVDILAPAHQTFLVAVPILRGGKLTGALVGLSRPVQSALSTTTPADPVVRLLRDDRGALSLPERAPPWAMESDFLSRLRELPGGTGAFRLASGEELFASESVVNGSGVTLIEVGNAEQITQPVRYRFRLQMLLLTSLQIGAVLLLSLFLRRTYSRFLGLERRALEQDRLLALGAASSLIAHEVKNSLNGLQAAASLLSTMPPAGQEADAALPVQSIRGEVDRLKHLASSLLLFGRPATAQLQRTGLPGLAREVVEALHVLPEAQDVHVQIEAPDELDVLCDPLLLTTAAHNLVRNAVEASAAAKDLGRISAPRVLVRVARRGTDATLEVEDNAGGVSPEVTARLFEPFVTDKPKGIGLGLSMTRRAMEAQHGTVTYELIPGGSRFILRLPAILEKAAASSDLRLSRGVA
jgi:signal transduction histidine kinase